MAGSRHEAPLGLARLHSGRVVEICDGVLVQLALYMPDDDDDDDDDGIYKFSHTKCDESSILIRNTTNFLFHSLQ